MKEKVKILTFLGYYLPGYKSGGPLRTIVNMVENIGDEFEFWIVTSDCDLGESSPYQGIKKDEWQKVGTANVYYISPRKCSFMRIRSIIDNTPHNILYLNSVFNYLFSIKPLIVRRFLNATSAPIVLAPRGEFSEGAFRLKNKKKKLFVLSTKFSSLYKDVIFQASSEQESQDIVRVLNVVETRIKIAINIPEYPLVGKYKSECYTDIPDTQGLKIIFLSRIVPKKNLDYAISLLAFVTESIQFDIYGPKEDMSYWRKCQVLMDRLPTNIVVNYMGSVVPSEVEVIFSKYDLFLFPTRGENYGHVIAESISVGTPVLISDKTPWHDLEKKGLGWIFRLDDPKLFADKINELSRIPYNVRLRRREIIRSEASVLLSNPKIIESNREMFRSLVRKVSK